MAPPRGSATYKKQDGTLSLSKDHATLQWTPVTPPGAKPLLEIPVSAITNLQQTPVTNPKVMLKVFAKQVAASQSHATPEAHTFTFTAPVNPRVEADAIKDALSKVISVAKAAGGDSLLAKPPAVPNGASDTGAPTSSSAAMAMASAVSSAPGASNPSSTSLLGDPSIYDDNALKTNIPLQQSLLKSSPSLSSTFMDALRSKPPSISSSTFTSQFWSSRLHLLRAHAIEKTQMRGQYNVLASIKPVANADNSGALKLSVSKEQISLIFSQHGLVKRVYDENVPRLKEEEFWRRFFQSRLFKKLKGEKITEVDATDAVLDKYLNVDEDAERARRLMAQHVPHIIDVEGNEENHSQRKGNKPDLTMRPTKGMPVIRSINDLSEKIMAQVQPNDVDPSLPIGMDEETFNQLALRDLQAEGRAGGRELQVKEASQFFGANDQAAQRQEDGSESAELRAYAKQNPTQILSSLRDSLREATSASFDLASSIGVDPDSDTSDDDDDAHDTSTDATTHVGSISARSTATRQILAAISAQRSSSSTPTSTSSPSTFDLPQEIFDRLTLTHATTTEFLSHFWSCFLSGDPSRAEELFQLSLTLDRAAERIKAVADAAEEEREKEVREMEGKLKAYQERTGKKARFDFAGIKGGRAAVEGLLDATVRAVDQAREEYRRAVRQAEAESGDAMNGT